MRGGAAAGGIKHSWDEDLELQKFAFEDKKPAATFPVSNEAIS